MAAKATTPETPFAAVHGSPGAKARASGLIRLFWPLLLLMMLGGYLVRAALPVPKLSPSVAAGLLGLLAAILAIQLQRSRYRLAAFLKGARGEEMVAHLLGFLPESYHVFHGGDADPGQTTPDYDHVVVGPTGIFVIETKNWEGRVTLQDNHVLCDGAEPTRCPLDQVKKAAAHVRKLLDGVGTESLEVTPILCFAGSPPCGGTQGIAGVMVCHASALCDLIKRISDAPLAPGISAGVSARLKQLYPED